MKKWRGTVINYDGILQQPAINQRSWPICDNAYGFRFLIFERVTTVAELICFHSAKELRNSKQSVLLE